MFYVNSGKCRVGVVGDKTGLVDCRGNKLFVGDIVMVFNDSYMPDGLTVVVSDEFTSYSDGTVCRNHGPAKHFIMGIKSEGLGDKWHALRVKSHRDVIAGEHWPEYGFSYTDEGGE